MKQRDLLAQVLGAVKEELPEVYSALIGTCVHTSFIDTYVMVMLKGKVADVYTPLTVIYAYL